MLNLLALAGVVVLQAAPGANVAITHSETPRPLRHELELRVACGGKQYVVLIEGQGPSTSKLLRATADGTDVAFHSAEGDLSEAISAIGVTGMTPSGCDPSSGALTMSLRGYDQVRDAAAGDTGEISRLFTAQIRPARGAQ